MRRLVCLLALLALAAPAGARAADRAPSAAQAARSALAAALADPHRTEADRARDGFRHPVETLGFCRVQPGMSVVEIMPGGGWWTRILPYYLGEQGHYIALNPDVRTASAQMQQFMGNTAATWPDKAAQWTGLPAARLPGYNSDGLPPAMNGTVDRVMIMRQVHNLHRMSLLYSEMATVRRLLKPDGLLCIEEHRARANAPADYTDGNKGYLREMDVIALMQAHGFDLVARSNINANRRDTADYPDGVWTLPPTYRLGDKDRARYTAIGEADRMTLLFRKRP
jgi:predicted methyltransferase